MQVSYISNYQILDWDKQLPLAMEYCFKFQYVVYLSVV